MVSEPVSHSRSDSGEEKVGAPAVAQLIASHGGKQQLRFQYGHLQDKKLTYLYQETLISPKT